VLDKLLEELPIKLKDFLLKNFPRTFEKFLEWVNKLLLLYKALYEWSKPLIKFLSKNFPYLFEKFVKWSGEASKKKRCEKVTYFLVAMCWKLSSKYFLVR
jgi:hypothetical protein